MVVLVARRYLPSRLAQRHQRINPSGPACRQVTCHHRYSPQDEGRPGEADRVTRPHAEQDPAQGTADQERCCALFRTTGDADLVKWAELHADIIRRFGRFPHRNAVLGRATSADEQAFLDSGGFAG